MKHQIKASALALLLGISINSMSCAQGGQRSETITKELQFEKSSAENVVYITNINGNVTVEGYDGKTIKIEVLKTITGKTDSRIEEGMKEISVAVLDRLDTIIVFMKGPCGEFSNKSDRWKNKNSTWGYNWSDCNEIYEFNLDFKVLLPENLNLYVSTINDGDIRIDNVMGNLATHNINGSIEMNNILGKSSAYTINGDVTLNFKRNPSMDSKFYTLNGDINANFQPKLSADLSFKSFNGEFFTNVSPLEHLPSSMEATTSNNGRGIKYKLNGSSRVRTRSGGVNLDFETFNGDVYVKEIN